MDGKYNSIITAARKARAFAYAPYSGYKVGAAILAEDGRIFTGVNIENASYPAGICAERAALSAAISAGCRRFSAIALCADGDVTPCGICRQCLSEFGDMIVLCIGPDHNNSEDLTPPKTHMLSDLLPEVFDKNKLI